MPIPPLRLPKQALDLNPNAAEARLILGSAYASQQKYAEAAPEIEAFVAQNPENPAGPLSPGTSLFPGRAEADKAEARIRSGAESRSAECEKVCSPWRMSISARKAPDKAIARVNQAIAAHPSNPVLHQVLGQVYLMQRNRQKLKRPTRKPLRSIPKM